MSAPPPSSSGVGVPSSAQNAGDRQVPSESSAWQQGYLRMLSDASREGLKNHTLHLPWETGVSREIFGKIRRAPEFVKHPYPPIAPPTVASPLLAETSLCSSISPFTCLPSSSAVTLSPLVVHRMCASLRGGYVSLLTTGRDLNPASGCARLVRPRLSLACARFLEGSPGLHWTREPIALRIC